MISPENRLVHPKIKPENLLSAWHFHIGDGTQGVRCAMRHQEILRLLGASVDLEELILDTQGKRLIQRIHQKHSGPRNKVLLLGGEWVGKAFPNRVNHILGAANTVGIPSIIIGGPEYLIGVRGNFKRIQRPKNIGLELIEALSEK